MKYLIILLAVLLLAGCSDTENLTECERLKRSFDNNKDIGMEGCDKLGNDEKLWVGATLVNKDTEYMETEDKYRTELLFFGKNKEGKIYITHNREEIPYEEDEFYKFDLQKKCRMIYSIGESGTFYDPDLNAFKEKECNETEDNQ